MPRAGALAALCALGIAACGQTSHTTTAPAVPGTSTSAAASSRTSTATAASRAATSAAAGIPSGDWTEFGFGAQHTGAGPANTGITARNLRRLSVRTIRIDGIADSAAVELHAVPVRGARRDVAVVTTSYGNTIAFDAGTGRTLWEFRPAHVNASPGNPQVTTATPVVDPDRAAVYTASPNGVVHKLALATGHQMWARPVTFDPAHEKIASALTISGRWLVVVTGGYFGDAPPYDGHVVTIDRASGRIAHVWNTECSNRHALIPASSCPATRDRGDSAIWGRAGAVIEPGSDRILVATGNGPFDGATSWGDSVLELSPDAATLLHNWTPTNQAQLAAGDTDLGSTSPALLGTFGGRRLAVQAGKDGQLHLLDLDRLNGTAGGAGRRLGGQLQRVQSPGGSEVLAQPAVWSDHGTTYLFVGDDSGTGAYRLVDPAHPRLAPVWEVGQGSTSPVLAGGLLYTYDPAGTLDVRAPRTGHVLRAFPVPGGHWSSPIVVGGRIILPTGTYHSSASASVIEVIHLPGR